MKLPLFLISALVCTHFTSATANETVTTKTLNFSLAQRAVQQALDTCSKRGHKVSAALVGRDGNLLAFGRHPLSGPHTIEVSQRKAFSAASLQVSTTGLASQRPDLNFAPGILLIQGGLPISVAGHFYGGIAVAGADTQTDEECAASGFALLSETLEFSN